MPQDLPITHIILYAVRPELIHEHLLYIEPVKDKKSDELLLKTNMVDPISDHLLDSVIHTRDDEGENYPTMMVINTRSKSANDERRKPVSYERKDFFRSLLSGQLPQLR